MVPARAGVVTQRLGWYTQRSGASRSLPQGSSASCIVLRLGIPLFQGLLGDKSSSSGPVRQAAIGDF